MATKEELMAWIAEREKQAGIKKAGKLEFKVIERRERLRVGQFPHDPLLRTVDQNS